MLLTQANGRFAATAPAPPGKKESRQRRVFRPFMPQLQGMINQAIMRTSLVDVPFTLQGKTRRIAKKEGHKMDVDPCRPPSGGISINSLDGLGAT